MKPKIILVGGGGHCRACIDVIELEGKYNIAGIVDRKEKRGDHVLGYKIIGTDDDLKALSQNIDYFLVTTGQIKSSETRRRLFQQLKNLGVTLPTVVSPLAYISSHATIGEGSIVMHHALVNAGVVIGSNCIVNSKALLEHDSTVKDHCHIATGAIINGGATIDSGVFFGSNSVCRESVKVGEGAVIGCGVTVLKDIDAGTVCK